MREIRVLVVDDSTVARRVLREIIEDEPGLCVAGLAIDGRQALAMLDESDPDLVTLDIEMPEMDGLTALKELRRRRPRLPVIMFSTLTHRGASATIEALSLGASDYVAKPVGAGGLREHMERLRLELVPRIRALARMGGWESRPIAQVPETSPLPSPTPRREPFPAERVLSPSRPTSSAGRALDPSAPGRQLTQAAELLLIGVSTGGPSALARLLPSLPDPFPVPVLIVQHMPPLFTRMLAERLDQLCPLQVREAEPGIRPEPGEVWLARGDRHLEVARESGRLALCEHQGPPVNSCRPAVDLLFLSAARACGSSAVALVLTGMGHDGLDGARAIRAAGGLVLAQDEESSVVWGMPGAVAGAGLADAVLPLEALGAQVAQLLRPARLAAGRIPACR